MNRKRLKWVEELLSRLGLDGFLVTSLENVRYFSGFTGSDAALVLTQDRRQLLTDSRYTIQAGAETEGYEIVQYIKKAEGIAETVLACHLGHLGFESQHMSYALHTDLACMMHVVIRYA